MTKPPVRPERGKSTVKAKATKSPKSAATAQARPPKAAAVEVAVAPTEATPPAPKAIKEKVSEPMVDAAPPQDRVEPEIVKTMVKAKVRTAPKPAKTALARAPKAAAAKIADAAPVELPPAAVPPLESDAGLASDSLPVPEPSIEAAAPVPEPVEVAASVELETPSETAPIETVTIEGSELVDEIEASPEEQSEEAVTGEDVRPAAPMLEDLVHLVTDRNPLLNAAPGFVRQNLNVMADSSCAATAGLEALSQEIAEFGLRQFDEAFAAWKRLLQTRSPTEGFKSQCDYAQGALDGLLGQGTKVTLAVIKLASDVTEPISRQHGLGVN